MDWDLYRKIVQQSAGKVHDLYLFHRGEPLLHPRLVEMIDYAEHQGIPTRIHTNATLLTESLSRRLLSSRLPMISFSFDGYDQATYEQNRPPSRFADTLAKIELFLTLKKENKNSRIITILQIMGLPPGSRGRALEDFTARLKPRDWIGWSIGIPIIGGAWYPCLPRHPPAPQKPVVAPFPGMPWWFTGMEPWGPVPRISREK